MTKVEKAYMDGFNTALDRIIEEINYYEFENLTLFDIENIVIILKEKINGTR